MLSSSSSAAAATPIVSYYHGAFGYARKSLSLSLDQNQKQSEAMWTVWSFFFSPQLKNREECRQICNGLRVVNCHRKLIRPSKHWALFNWFCWRCRWRCRFYSVSFDLVWTIYYDVILVCHWLMLNIWT